MAAVGIMVHPDRSSAVDLAADAADWLSDRGHDVRFPRPDADRCDRSELGVSDDEFAAGLDLLVSIGGDGSMLRAVEAVSTDSVPVLGVNAGTLGYLSAVEAGQMRGAIKRFLAGAYRIENRMRVAAECDDGHSALALNEVIVEKRDPGHTVRLEVHLDDDYFTTFAADGVIVATPTGSTAYAFSVRGPIIDPSHRATLLCPVAPHMLFDRALVLPPTTSVQLTVRGRPARVSVDGRALTELGDGARITVRGDAPPAQLVTFGDRDFHRILREKFGLVDR